jgi:hypothetical protein
MTDYKFYTNLFKEYFSAIPFGLKNVELVQSEVLVHLKMLLSEDRRLQRQLSLYEVE